jgi:hypothetical protein
VEARVEGNGTSTPPGSEHLDAARAFLERACAGLRDEEIVAALLEVRLVAPGLLPVEALRQRAEAAERRGDDDVAGVLEALLVTAAAVDRDEDNFAWNAL